MFLILCFVRIPLNAFQNAVNHFRSHLEIGEFEKIVNLPTTFSDVVAALISCKNARKMGKSKGKGKKREYLDQLLQRIHHFKGVVDAAVQSSPQIASLVWASIRFLVEVCFQHSRLYTATAWVRT